MHRPKCKLTGISSHRGKESIDYVVCRGLRPDTPETTFAPNIAMSRGILVTPLGRLAGVDVKPYTKSSFTEVNAGSYYLPYIEWATKNNIVSGYASGKFRPNDSITREQL